MGSWIENIKKDLKVDIFLKIYKIFISFTN